MGSRLSLSDMSSRIDRRILWVFGPGWTTKLVSFWASASRGGLGIGEVVNED